MKCHTIIVVLFIIGCSANGLPADVEKFTTRRADCDHLRGEVSGEPDPEGNKALEDSLNKYCKGTDRELAELRAKHIKNQAVIDLLTKYETSIEADD